MKRSLIVVGILLIIGMLTASWRCDGTILYFVYWGIKLITPHLFLIIAFLITCLMSYSIGSSFGVACTLGVIFMALARSGGVNEAIAAGVIMSGVYFGDRASPAASSLILTAAVTGTNALENVKLLMKTALVPYGICLAAYSFLSFKNPLSQVDKGILSAITSDFQINGWLAVPALIMLILPLLKINIRLTMILSVLAAGFISVLVQNVPLTDFLYACIMGYHSENGSLGSMLNGGGLISMVEIGGILLISCTYSNLFEAGGMIAELQMRLETAIRKTSRFFVHILSAVLFAAIFCNQTIAIMMSSAVLKKPYRATGGSDQELAIDIGNSTILISGLIPWCIACSVPLQFLDVGIEALPYAILLYSIPLCHLMLKPFRHS